MENRAMNMNMEIRNLSESNMNSDLPTNKTNNAFDIWENIYLKLEEISSWSEFINENGYEGIKVFTYVKTTITIIGLLENVTTLLSLILNGNLLPLIGRILLIHQATIDTFICLMAIVIYNQPFMWMTENVTLDLLLCQIWHGQAIYWGAVLLSVWNVILIAFERFILLNHPVKHRNLRQNVVYKAFAMMYLFSVICLLPAYLQVKYVKYYGNSGSCLDVFYVNGEVFRNFMKFYGVFWFLIVYAIPIGFLITLYSKIILKLRQRTKSRRVSALHQQHEPSIIDLAHRQITKTAVAIAIVFVISLSWESFYCLLGFTGLIKYEFNKPLQVTGIFLATFCSCSTPFIYAASMPIFRNSVRKTFGCRIETSGVNTNNFTAHPTKDYDIPLQPIHPISETSPIVINS